MTAPARSSDPQRTGTVRDVIAPGLRVLFCGINPSLRSGATGHHFAHPGNRFWKVLQRSGLTPELLSPDDDQVLLAHGIGITNLVPRSTRTAGELSSQELRAGALRLEGTARRFVPKVVAVVGMGAYRTAFGRPSATLGSQPERIGPSRLWLLPNPSGLQAHYQMDDLVEAFRTLRAQAW